MDSPLITGIRPVFLAWMCVAAVACSASYPTGPSAPTPVWLMLWQPPHGPVPVNANWRTYQAYVLDSDGAYHIVTAGATWESSDPRVARPTSAGSFVPSAPGSSRITVRYQGLEASRPMIVFDPLVQPSTRLDVSAFGAGLVGQTGFVQAILERPGARQLVSDRVTLSSSDPDIVAVSGRTMTALKIGTAVITVTLDDFSEWFWVSVAPK